MVSRECAHTTQRDEAFTMVSLDVKNKSTLQQSLELFVAGDLLDGDNKYSCTACKVRSGTSQSQAPMVAAGAIHHSLRQRK